MRMLFPLIGRLKYFALQHQKTEKVQASKNERLVLTEFRFLGLTFVRSLFRHGWIGRRVASVLDSGPEGPGLNRSRDAVG